MPAFYQALNDSPPSEQEQARNTILTEFEEFNTKLKVIPLFKTIDDSNSHTSVSDICVTFKNRLGKFGNYNKYKNLQPLLESLQKLKQSLEVIPAEEQGETSLYTYGCAAWIKSIHLIDPILGMGNGFVDHLVYSTQVAVELNLSMLSNTVNQTTDVITSPISSKAQAAQKLLQSTEELRLRLEGRAPWRYENRVIRQGLEVFTAVAGLALFIASFAMASNLAAYAVCISAALMIGFLAFKVMSEWQGALQLSNPISGESLGDKASYETATSYKTLAHSAIALYGTRSNAGATSSVENIILRTSSPGYNA
jgi:hypothetical protein